MKSFKKMKTRTIQLGVKSSAFLVLLFTGQASLAAIDDLTCEEIQTRPICVNDPNKFVNINGTRRICISNQNNESYPLTPSFNSNTEVWVLEGSSFQPTGMNGGAGQILNCGTVVLPAGINIESVRLRNFGEFTINQHNMNGSGHLSMN